MYISRVELENIKSYESADYHFERGITAISGPNGAGKTTIIEAIAYALFDSIEYSKADFLKRGTKKGSVRVTFVSSVDAREYTVYRDTANGFYVYDPITRMRVVEQKNQVLKWIGEHLGVDAGVDLNTLFSSTIGVPQGTFTVDFAESPQKRKTGFDKVLRVEEYSSAAEKLRLLIKLLEEKGGGLREEMARLEGEIAKLDEIMAEDVRLENTIKQLQNEKTATETELLQIRAEVERLDSLKQRLEMLNAESISSAIRLQELQKKRHGALQLVEQSRRADEMVRNSQAGFALYGQATSKLTALEPQIQQRDDLRSKERQKDRQKIKVEALLQTKQELLDALAAEKAEAERLQPFVKEQLELEKRQLELEKRLTELTILARKAAKDEQELHLLREEYQEIKQKIQEAESLKDLAESVDGLEEQRKQCEEALREVQVTLEGLRIKRIEQQRLKDNLAKLKGEIKTLASGLADLALIQQRAELLGELEANDTTLSRSVIELRLQITREQQFVAEVQNGLCPLLSQRCLNMKEGQTLDAHFKVQLADETKRLRQLESKQTENTERLSESRIASRKLSGLLEQGVSLERRKQEFDLEKRNLMKLEKEIDRLASGEAQLETLLEKRSTLLSKLQTAQSARISYKGLEPLRNHLHKLKEDGQERRNAFHLLQAELAEKPELDNNVQEIATHLMTLADPKSRFYTIEKDLAKEPGLQADLAALSKEAKSLQTEIDLILNELNGFAELDETLFRLREQREVNSGHYQLYIEHQPIAALLQIREEEWTELDKELQQQESKLLEINEIIAVTSLDYDAALLITLKEKLEWLIGKSSALGSELTLARKRSQEVKEVIEKLLEVREQIVALQREKSTQEQLTETSDFMRDLLKKAGPFITEAHLQSISMEANQLYRDVTGNPIVSLRWDLGYEIIIEEDGHERPFISLSGGEKMSAALSVRLALLKELSDIRIAFFDEPTANMDEERRRNLAQQIGAIKDFNQLFVVSHDDTFEGFTDRVINVSREA